MVSCVDRELALQVPRMRMIKYQYVGRMVGTYFAVSCGTLNTKEKIFMAFAWMPKATVQGILTSISTTVLFYWNIP